MNKILILIVLLQLLTVIPLHGNDFVEFSPLIWEIDNGTSETKSHIVGTIHISSTGKEIRASQPLVELIKTKKKIILETDSEKIDRRKLMEMVTLPQGKTIKDYISDEKWEKLKVITTENKLPLPVFMKYRPWFLAQMLVLPKIKKFQSMEAFITKIARKNEIELDYFEEWDEQLGFFSEIPQKENVKGLEELIDKLDDEKKKLELIEKAYMKRDMEELNSIIFNNEDIEKFPETYRIIFEKRNRNWIDRIVKHVSEGDVLIAVGAGHLTGKNSVLELLRKKGYRVERFNEVKSSGEIKLQKFR